MLPFNFGGLSRGEAVAAGAGGLAGGSDVGSAKGPGEWPPQAPSAAGISASSSLEMYTEWRPSA